MGQAGTSPETGAAARIVVACAPGQPGPEALRRLLAAADPAPELVEHDSLASALSDRSHSPVLIPVSAALESLTDALAQGTLPSSALQDWKARTRTLLEQCRQHRRDVLLVDAESLAHAPRQLAPLLFARLNLTVPETLPDPEATPRPVRPVLEILVHAMLTRTAPVRALVDELEAMTLTASNPVQMPTPLLDLAYQEIRDQDGLKDSLDQYESEIAKLGDNNAALGEERDLLRTSLAQLRDELATLVEAQTRRDTQTREQEAEAMLHRAAHDSARRQLELHRAEQQRREAVLGAEILDSQTREADLHQEVDTLSGELDRVFNSRSWRVTTPLRRLRGGA